MNKAKKLEMTIKALKRIADHETRADRKHTNMVNVSEIHDLQRTARITLDCLS